MSDLGIVVNSNARNAASLANYLDALKQHHIAYKLYQSKPDKLQKNLEQAVQNHSIILIGGGDGTVRSCAQLCVNKPITLGVLPLGTLNHFVQELGLPVNPEEIAKAIQEKKTVTVDVAEVNGHIFVNNSSIGFYPHFALKRNHYNKFYNKWLSYLPGFIDALKTHPSFNIHLNSEALDEKLNTSFLMISNNLYGYEFPLKFARSHFNQSELGIYYFKHGILRISKIIRYFFKRKDSFALKSSLCPLEISINDKTSVKVSVDGEVLTLNTPLRYKILPQSLIVLTSMP